MSLSIVLTYLLRPAPRGAQAINDCSPSHSILGCSRCFIPADSLLSQLFLTVSPPAAARPSPLPFTLRVPTQGLSCDAGCWLPEGMTNPAPLPPQDLPCHRFLARSLPQIFVPYFLWPSDAIYAPQTCVEERLDFLLQCLRRSPCLASI